MNDTGILKGLIISHPPTLEQARRQNQRFYLLGTLLVALCCLLPTIFGIKDLWQAWQEARWDSTFWQDTFTMQVFVPFITIFSSAFGFAAYFSVKARENIRAIDALPLREAATTGDDRLAPLAERQLESLSTTGGTIDPSQGEHLRLRAALAPGKHIEVFVHEEGVEWNNPQWWQPGTHHISWGEVRAFYTFFYLHTGRRQSERQQVYVLETSAETLAWVDTWRWNIDAQQEKPASERLQSLITDRTRLPLRDLTKAADKLAMYEPATVSRLSGLSTDEAGLFSPSLGLAPPQSKRRKRPLFPLIGFAPVLLLVLFASTAFGLQTYQQSLYNALLAQIHTHKPLFHDTLSAPDGNWTVHLSAPAINVGPSTYGYVKGSYQLQGVNVPTLTAPGVYGAVAVEVTVRLLGKLSYDDRYDSFGLMLHIDGIEPQAVYFDISPDGIWSIDPFANVFASSTAINTSPGAPNRLAVILRDHQDILYINNQFVGIYQDSGPTTGPLGFEAETDTASAAFTDFTIYPL